MTVADFEMALASLLAWREERSNGSNGMLAVLFVLRNRVKAGWHEGSWTRNIDAHNQFSSISVLGDSQTIAYPDVRDPQFLQILQAVDSVYEGNRVDNLSNGALYYADLASPGYTKGGWFQRNIIEHPDLHPRVATVGTTTYFK